MKYDEIAFWPKTSLEFRGVPSDIKYTIRMVDQVRAGRPFPFSAEARWGVEHSPLPPSRSVPFHHLHIPFQSPTARAETA